MKKMCLIIGELFLCGSLACARNVSAQSLRVPWSGYAHSAQHGAAAAAASQPLKRILWSTPVDLNPVDSDGDLLIHYGSPLVTRSNTVIVPVKTGATNGVVIMAFAGATGATNWTLASDYVPPPHNWFPSFSPALTPKNRLYFPGAG